MPSITPRAASKKHQDLATYASTCNRSHYYSDFLNTIAPPGRRCSGQVFAFTDVAGSPKQAAQNAAQSADVLPRGESRGVQETAICEEKRGYVEPNKYLMGDTGLEPVTSAV
jgi:hypothetical protein